MANIAWDDALILLHGANPAGLNFREPQVQNHLFQEVVASQGESVRSQLAVFLHNKHSRTSEASSWWR
jgi:hypothetical protein